MHKLLRYYFVCLVSQQFKCIWLVANHETKGLEESDLLNYNVIICKIFDTCYTFEELYISESVV